MKTDKDIRDEIFKSVSGKRVTASLVADGEGVMAETEVVRQEAASLGLSVEKLIGDGSAVRKGEEIGRFVGSPKQVAMAEEVLIGILAKPSGIATAARRCVEHAGERPEIVCGAWKKMPPSQKNSIRRAIAAGGARFRICREPFVYLDKNYVEMLGGIEKSLHAVAGLNGRVRVVQLKGRYGDITHEAMIAVRNDADILFVDTGNREDIRRVVSRMSDSGMRERVKIAFGGDIGIDDIDELKELDVDILDIGRHIVDAPLLDMKIEVVRTDL